MKKRRALWLINHTTLRQFEVPVLQRLGYEVFVPKKFPYDEGNLSATVDFSFDADLSIPSADLDLLNQHDFYTSISPQIAKTLNAYFDIAFFAFFPQQLAALARDFKGTLVMRAFGVPRTSYTDITNKELGHFFLQKLERFEHRFWFGQAYSHLSDSENGIFRRKAITLPLGLADARLNDQWIGSDPRILFICPRIRTSPYFAEVYRQFKVNFADLPYTIAGAQPVAVPDQRVRGYLSRSEYDDVMRTARVMFYHGQEPNHLHYHPFEAIRLGMPLLFMAGGMIDRLGGKELPGRCINVQDARRKVERILNGDRRLIDRIRESQSSLLSQMDASSCIPAWRSALDKITHGFLRTEGRKAFAPTRKRIAVILPKLYRGGTLRAALLFAQAIAEGSRINYESAEIVFGHLDDASCYDDDTFIDLPKTIMRRPFQWRMLSREEAARACTYAGFEQELTEPIYQAPDDGINQFADCDLWIIVSDRLDYPLVPIRPHLLAVFDYLQRYEQFLDDQTNQKLLSRAQSAEAILVTTEFTMRDALQFAGISRKKVEKVPMLAPSFQDDEAYQSSEALKPYFLWTTNLGLHKNHHAAFEALRLYYERHGGSLECRIAGVETRKMMTGTLPHLKELQKLFKASPFLKKNLKFEGELADRTYWSRLKEAAFLWHAGRIDNGTFSVVEAAYLKIPGLSSRYPAMREIDEQFGLNLMWMDPNNPDEMGRRLKEMEETRYARRSLLPTAETLAKQSVQALCGSYWATIRKYL